MKINRIRAMLAAAVIVALIGPGAAFNAIAARRTTAFPGSVTVESPDASQKIRRATTVQWSWRAGTYVKSTSRVDVIASDGYRWYPVATGLPIRNGEFDWDTSAWPDEDYVVRVQVQRTTIRGTSPVFYIDNTAPTIRISRPSQGEILVENDTRVFFATIVGTARLEAEARDNLTGVSEVRWLLDGEQIGTGNPLTYNFSFHPGQHELTAIAKDAAGNESSPSTIVVLCFPGPSATEGDPSSLLPEEAPNPEDLVPEEQPNPEDLLPGDDLPDPEDLTGEVPNPEDTTGEVPNPDDTTGNLPDEDDAPSEDDLNDVVSNPPDPSTLLP